MNIKIEPEPKEWTKLKLPQENCIFCAQQTNMWNIASNRPVCKTCSQMYNFSQIQSAPYNY